ncbi:MDR family MFS transporter [Alicyclobacillus dauci]|uniref:MFS transporter n=1 Tax=Alicyclobacillus dauci TaxID=1475485 RepID=A0ABY6Z633_9BACL|nr:MFS transporter [Alicyclobacillus dauci]WAH38282.1 MFS transporter [Alicyclobacillus dauci]
MIRIGVLLKGYHPLVWWVVAGTMLTRFTSFMVMPFMALYMKTHTHAGAGTIGFSIGCAALTSMAFGLIGGSLSDRFGRKQLMIVAMVLNVLVMIGYANARNVAFFFILSICTGLTRVLFEPASQAMLADVTSLEKRASVFAMRYWAINVGAAVGPIVGGYFGTVSTGWTFYLSAFANFLYLGIVILKFPKGTGGVSGPSKSFSFRNTFRTVTYDKALLLFLIAAFLSNIGYSQMETTLPQVMSMSMDQTTAAAVFGIVLSSNAIEVVLLQLPMSKIAKRMGLVSSMMVGQAIFAVGYVATGFSSGLWSYLLAMFIITIGEIIIFPQNSQYISELAHEDMRASYFGAWSMAQLGFFVGPWLGGLVLPHFGGCVLFTTAGIIVAVGIPFYKWSNAKHVRKEKQVMDHVSV